MKIESGDIIQNKSFEIQFNPQFRLVLVQFKFFNFSFLNDGGKNVYFMKKICSTPSHLENIHYVILVV